jgi:mRNA interferase MazF
MTGYEFGEIVLVPFPFTDQSATKHRPTIVISSTAYHRARPDLIIMAVTSQQPTSDALGEVVVEDWRAADCSSHLCQTSPDDD